MTTVTQDYLVRKVREGDVTVFSKRQDVLQGESEYYYLSNPSDSEEIEIEGISATAGSKMDVNIYTDVTENTEGSQMNAMNSRVGSSVVQGLTRRYGGDYTGNDEPLEDTIPGSEGGNGAASNVAGAHAEGNTISLPPGEEILLEFVNSSQSDSYVAPRFVVVE